MKKENKGITLIALVITIIVLLILVGVTVITLTGDNGLLVKTSESKFITEIQQYNEELKLAITEDYTNSMGNRQNKFNVRKSNYNDENSFIDAMKTKIPSFNNKYANKLEIKEDKLNYIGDDEQERAWLAQVISVAGMLKINYVYENGTEAATPYQQVIPDGSYEVESPKIDGYEPDHYIVCGEIEGDINITVTYYPPSEGLEYELLDDGTYTVAGIGTFTGSTLVIPAQHEEKDVTQIKTNAFYNNSSLKVIVIPNTIKKVNSQAFRSCNIIYANIDAEQIADQALQGCGYLEKLDIGKNVKILGQRICMSASKVRDVTILTEQAYINGRILECQLLEKIKVNKDNNMYKEIDGVLFSKDGKKLYVYPISKVGNTFKIPEEVEEIEENAFYNSLYLKNININNTIKNVKSSAFSWTNIEFAYLNSENNNGEIFKSSKIKNIKIGTNVKVMTYRTFRDCNNIEEIEYEGTIEEWNLINTNRWNVDNVIKRVICSDGTIEV